MKVKAPKNTYQFGILAEKITMIYLRFKGYKIIKWRFKNYFGEIDIIAKNKNLIAIIEVKARKKKILLEDAVSDSQIKRIINAAEYFIAKNPKYHKCQLRFDLIEVGRFFLIKHHKNFF